MIEIDTVFILGAGASKPYGYPTGKELRSFICSNFTSHFNNILCNDNHTALDIKGDYTKASIRLSKKFKDSSTPSIDLWLTRNPDFLDVGKLAITLKIFTDEQKSKFREDIQYPEQDWYSYLYHKMTKSLIKPDSYKKFRNNKVAFVTFNYDRSLEQFLYESLKDSFTSACPDEIIEELREIPFFHVYGKVADLDWEFNRGKKRLYYLNQYNEQIHEKFSLESLQEKASNITIVHEGEQHDCSDIQDKISNAKKIFFLGFGYASENLEILRINKILNDDYHIFGTALGFSKKEIEGIRESIMAGFEFKNPQFTNPRIKDTDCLTLLREFL